MILEKLKYNVYVVLLDEDVRSLRKFRAANPLMDPFKPCLYVGMTSLSPKKRLANHLKGYKASRYVRKFGIELLPELFAHLNPLPRKAAIEMEKDLADDLRQQGYGVWQR